MASIGSATFIKAPARIAAAPITNRIGTPGRCATERAPSTVDAHNVVRSLSGSEAAGERAPAPNEMLLSSTAETMNVAPLTASMALGGPNRATSAVSAGPTVIPMLKFAP